MLFSTFLIKLFIKDSERIEDLKVRTAYGFFSGMIGIIINLILFAVKLSVGLISSSIAITADAFNNLNDSASSLITIIGFKLSNAPADEEHPFGHGRIEYISAFIVSLMVLLVGFEFVKSSFDRIIHPTPLSFEIIPFTLIALSIGVKIWLSKFNGYVGEKINSAALKASSFDALGDVIISTVTAFTLLLSRFSSLAVDGYMGMLVAIFILYSGIKLAKETLNPILGEPPDPKLVKAIKEGVLSYEHISGTHDLIIHNYGPGKFIATIHAEVPSDIDIVKIHNIIDDAERELSKKLNIILVIHMDPINVDNEEINETRKQVWSILSNFTEIKSLHDFRIIGEGEHKNIVFDIVVDSCKKMSAINEENLKAAINTSVKKIYPLYNCVVTLDKDFSDL